MNLRMLLILNLLVSVSSILYATRDSVHMTYFNRELKKIDPDTYKKCLFSGELDKCKRLKDSIDEIVKRDKKIIEGLVGENDYAGSEGVSEAKIKMLHENAKKLYGMLGSTPWNRWIAHRRIQRWSGIGWPSDRGKSSLYCRKRDCFREEYYWDIKERVIGRENIFRGIDCYQYLRELAHCMLRDHLAARVHVDSLIEEGEEKRKKWLEENPT